MKRKDFLEEGIRASYQIIQARYEMLQTTSRPEEQLESQRTIDKQWKLVKGFYGQYAPLCQKLKASIPEDISEIVSYFGDQELVPDQEFYSANFEEAYNIIFQTIPQSDTTLGWFALALQEIEHYHELIAEWKELHNLLQEAVTSLTPFVGEIEFALVKSEKWSSVAGQRLFRPTRVHLQRLQEFAREIKYIDKPFFDQSGIPQGPKWMIEIVILLRDLDISMHEGDMSGIYEILAAILHTCTTYLYVADKRLKKDIDSLHHFSRNILRSVQQ